MINVKTYVRVARKRRRIRRTRGKEYLLTKSFMARSHSRFMSGENVLNRRNCFSSLCLWSIVFLQQI